MATLDRLEMVDFLLEHVGVKPAGVDASADDVTLGGRIVDSVHARLEYLGLVTTTVDVFPEWLQLPFAQVAAVDCVQPFQLGTQVKAQIEHDHQRAMREFYTQTAVRDVAMVTPFKDC